ncbi:hypothetical protein F7725_022795 [Dissostichus mawsoni]|uniref:Uncharacterized protein n=1 Tax=Dissostichus mawsoni TaxID=36200 RepID=A0A7J5YZ44_DISMA|nr:hypothetical protein F7725_022795 [Dissostichus mawsoni]
MKRAVEASEPPPAMKSQADPKVPSPAAVSPQRKQSTPSVKPGKPEAGTAPLKQASQEPDHKTPEERQKTRPNKPPDQASQPGGKQLDVSKPGTNNQTERKQSNAAAATQQESGGFFGFGGGKTQPEATKPAESGTGKMFGFGSSIFSSASTLITSAVQDTPKTTPPLKEWLCLTCQTQRAVGATHPKGVSSVKSQIPAKQKKDLISSAEPEKKDVTQSKPSVTPQPTRTEAANKQEDQKQPSPVPSPKRMQEPQKTPGPNKSPAQARQSERKQSNAAAATQQESGGFFGFGGGKTQPDAAKPAESGTGKMFGFGSSIFSSASTLISSAVQDQPKTTPPVSPKMSAAKEIRSPAAQKKEQQTKPEQPQETKTPPSVQAKAKEWLCLTCQTQRAVGATQLPGVASVKSQIPAKPQKKDIISPAEPEKKDSTQKNFPLTPQPATVEAASKPEEKKQPSPVPPQKHPEEPQKTPGPNKSPDQTSKLNVNKVMLQQQHGESQQASLVLVVIKLNLRLQSQQSQALGKCLALFCIYFDYLSCSGPAQDYSTSFSQDVKEWLCLTCQTQRAVGATQPQGANPVNSQIPATPQKKDIISPAEPKKDSTQKKPSETAKPATTETANKPKDHKQPSPVPSPKRTQEPQKTPGPNKSPQQTRQTERKQSISTAATQQESGGFFGFGGGKAQPDAAKPAESGTGKMFGFGSSIFSSASTLITSAVQDTPKTTPPVSPKMSAAKETKSPAAQKKEQQTKPEQPQETKTPPSVKEWLCLTCQTQRAELLLSSLRYLQHPKRKTSSAQLNLKGKIQLLKKPSETAQPTTAETANKPEDQKQPSPVPSPKRTQEPQKTPGPNKSPQQTRQGERKQSISTAATQQESGGFFGFGGGKAQPDATKPAESGTGKMFGFGSSIFSSASTLITSAVQDQPKTTPPLKEWLCLTCQTQRAVGATHPKGVSSVKSQIPAKQKKDLISSAEPEKKDVTQSKPSVTPQPTRTESANKQEDQKQPSPVPSPKRMQEPQKTPGPNKSPAQTRQSERKQSNAAAATQQELGGFFGFGGGKTQPEATKPAESGTGKMFGFGSSIFSSASTLITSAVQDQPKTTPPIEWLCLTCQMQRAITAAESVDPPLMKPQASPNKAPSPVAAQKDVTANTKKDTISSVKAEVQDQNKTDSPTPGEKEWLCLNCQMQRALGASEPPGLPMIKPKPSPSKEVPVTTQKKATPMSTSEEDMHKRAAPTDELVNVSTTKDTEAPDLGVVTKKVSPAAVSLPDKTSLSSTTTTDVSPGLQKPSEETSKGHPSTPQQQPPTSDTPTSISTSPLTVPGEGKLPPQQTQKAVTSPAISTTPPPILEQSHAALPQTVTSSATSVHPPAPEAGKPPPQQPPKNLTSIDTSAPPPDQVAGKPPPQQPPKTLTSIATSAPPPDQVARKPSEQHPPKVGTSPAKSAPPPVEPAKQASGGFFGFGGPKTQPTATKSAESVSGKMFGFGSSFLNSASTLMTSAVQDEPKMTPPTPRKMSTTAHVSPRTTPPASPRTLPAKNTEALPQTLEKKAEKQQQKKDLSTVKEWLCLNCQMQRALGASEPTGHPVLKPQPSPTKVSIPPGSELKDIPTLVQRENSKEEVIQAVPKREVMSTIEAPVPIETPRRDSVQKTQVLSGTEKGQRQEVAGQQPSVGKPPHVLLSKTTKQEVKADLLKQEVGKPPQQPVKSVTPPAKATPPPAQPAKQESGGFFGFGGPKTQPAAAKPAESVTGKMFGFGSSIFSSASTLITTPPSPRRMSTTVSPKITPPKEWLCLNCQTQRALSGQLGDSGKRPQLSPVPATKPEPTTPPIKAVPIVSTKKAQMEPTSVKLETMAKAASAEIKTEIARIPTIATVSPVTADKQPLAASTAEAIIPTMASVQKTTEKVTVVVPTTNVPKTVTVENKEEAVKVEFIETKDSKAKDSKPDIPKAKAVAGEAEASSFPVIEATAVSTSSISAEVAMAEVVPEMEKVAELSAHGKIIKEVQADDHIELTDLPTSLQQVEVQPKSQERQLVLEEKPTDSKEIADKLVDNIIDIPSTPETQQISTETVVIKEFKDNQVASETSTNDINTDTATPEKEEVKAERRRLSVKPMFESSDSELTPSPKVQRKKLAVTNLSSSSEDIKTESADYDSMDDEEFIRRQILGMGDEEKRSLSEDEKENNLADEKAILEVVLGDASVTGLSLYRKSSTENEESSARKKALQKTDTAATQYSPERIPSSTFKKALPVMKQRQSPDEEVESITESLSKGSSSVQVSSFTPGSSPTSASSLEEDSDSSPSHRKVSGDKHHRKGKHRQSTQPLPTIEDSSEDEKIKSVGKSRKDKPMAHFHLQLLPPATENLRQVIVTDDTSRTSGSEYSASLESESEAKRAVQRGRKPSITVIPYTPSDPSIENYYVTKSFKSAEEAYEEIFQKTEAIPGESPPDIEPLYGGMAIEDYLYESLVEEPENKMGESQEEEVNQETSSNVSKNSDLQRRFMRR